MFGIGRVCTCVHACVTGDVCENLCQPHLPAVRRETTKPNFALQKAIWQNDSDEEMGETGNGGIHRQRDEDGEMEGGRPREEEGEMEERIAETEEMLGAANSTRLRKCGYCGIHVSRGGG